MTRTIDPRSPQERPFMTPPAKPSARMCRILELKRDGKTDEQIVLQLHYSLSTVRGHLHTLYQQLGVGNCVEAILVALDEGWIAEPILEKPFKRALTAREESVIVAIEQGFTNAQTAKRLSITENTVKTHLQRIFDVTHCTTRTQPVAAFIASLR